MQLKLLVILSEKTVQNGNLEPFSLRENSTMVKRKKGEQIQTKVHKNSTKKHR